MFNVCMVLCADAGGVEPRTSTPITVMENGVLYCTHHLYMYHSLLSVSLQMCLTSALW